MSQGSVLELLLFLPIVNDLAAHSVLPCFVFADNVKFCGVERSGGIDERWNKCLTWMGYATKR